MTDIKQQLCDMCRLVYHLGMVCGSGGNISARDGSNIWITPSGYALGDLTPDDLVLVHADGSYEGALAPSKETDLHLRIYENRPDANAVVHLHSYYSIRVALGVPVSEQPMPAYTSAYAAKVGSVGMVPLLASGSRELAEAVVQSVIDHSAVLLQNHGIISVGTNLRKALNLCEDVEFNARMHLEQKNAGALTRIQIEALR